MSWTILKYYLKYLHRCKDRRAEYQWSAVSQPTALKAPTVLWGCRPQVRKLDSTSRIWTQDRQQADFIELLRVMRDRPSAARSRLGVRLTWCWLGALGRTAAGQERWGHGRGQPLCGGGIGSGWIAEMLHLSRAVLDWISRTVWWGVSSRTGVSIVSLAVQAQLQYVWNRGIAVLLVIQELTGK